MRWLLSALALCAAIFVALTAKRVLDVVSWFAAEHTDEPAPVAYSTGYPDDPRSNLPQSAAPPQASADGTLVESSSTSASEMQETFEEAFRAVNRARADLASPFAQVEQMAKQVAPDLANEVRERATDTVDRNPEVTHELLETYAEQKKILAGQRDTIDSVLKETTR